MSTSHRRSFDGGVTWGPGNAGGDNHDIWIDPLLPDRIAVGHDGGISISTNRGKSVAAADACRSRRCTTCSSTTRSPTS